MFSDQEKLLQKRLTGHKGGEALPYTIIQSYLIESQHLHPGALPLTGKLTL
jgi:hypothetical protein